MASGEASDAGPSSDLPVLEPTGASVEPEVEQHADRVIALVLQKIDQKIEQRIEHLHMPLMVPSAAEAAALKDQAPEVYDLWLRLAEKKADGDAELQRLPFAHPLQLAKRGQWFGLTGLVATLGFCAYLASLGGAAEYVAGVIAAIDLVSMVGVFMKGQSPDGPTRGDTQQRRPESS